MRALIMAVFIAGAPFTLEAAGGLYSPQSFEPLFSDERAHKVGDIINVLLIEVSSARASADSGEEGGFELNGEVTDASGSARGGIGIEARSTGKARTTRNAVLRGQVSARVEEKLSSGDFYIRGEQYITINGEHQRIRVEGVVRPQDIAPDNTILSSRILDARIEYDGEGFVSRSQKPGIFRRFLMFLGF